MALVLTLAAGALVFATPSAKAEPMEVVSYAGSLPQERVYASSAEVDGKIYVFGGWVSDIYGGAEAALNTVLIYDIESGETSNGANMTQGVAIHSCAMGEDGLIYVFGGYNSSLFGYLPAVQIYDPEADSWSAGADAPIDLGGAQAVCGPDGRFYLFGAGVWFNLNSTLIYDPVSDEWAYGADQPGEYAMRGTVTLNDTAIIVCGGYDVWGASEGTDAVDVYDVVSDSWTTVSPMLEPAGFGGAAISRDGLVYYLGGTDGSWLDVGSVSSRIQVYDPETDEWWLSDDWLWQSTAGFALATDEYGRFFVIGGYNGMSTMTSVQMVFASDVEVDEIRIASPSDGAVVRGDVMVTVSWTNPWNWIVAIDFYVDDVLVETQYPEWPAYEVCFLWYTGGLADGSSHDLMVRAFISDGSVKEDSVAVTYSAYSLDDRLDSLESALADLMAVLDSHSTDIAALQSAIDSLASDISALAATLGDIDDANAEMFASILDQLDGLDEALAALESSVGSDNQDLMDEIGALQDQIASLEDALGETNTDVGDVQTSVDDKMSATLGYAVIGLIVVVIILLIVMMVMARKTPPPPPAP